MHGFFSPMIQSGSFPSEPDHGRVSNAKAPGITPNLRNDFLSVR
jgi:hypothetical protein